MNASSSAVDMQMAHSRTAQEPPRSQLLAVALMLPALLPVPALLPAVWQAKVLVRYMLLLAAMPALLEAALCPRLLLLPTFWTQLLKPAAELMLPSLPLLLSLAIARGTVRL